LNGDSALHFIRKDGCTLLHVAAAAGSWRVVDLLLDAGVSPMPRDRRRKSAYDVSKDKETRDSFRRGMYVFIENTPRSVFL
jgi:ankyrin repeat protein